MSLIIWKITLYNDHPSPSFLLLPLSSLKTYLGLLTVCAMQLNAGLHGLDHVPSIQNCLVSLSSAWIAL